MTPALTGASIDGPLYTDVVRLADRAPAWLDTVIAAWSSYGLALFAILMIVGWWRARGAGSRTALIALIVPVLVVFAYAVDSLLKSLVNESRPCQGLRTATLEVCPGAGDWSFPSNHATIAAAAAVGLLFVSRRLGAIAIPAALAMAASRVWVGVHYPHDVLAGLAVGALVAWGVAAALRSRLDALAPRLAAGPLRPLLVA